MRDLVLASSSRYRAELLTRLGLPFTSRAPEVDETAGPDEPVQLLVDRLARSKAAAVATHCPQALIIGSDQIAVSGERMLGKPGSPERARQQLASLSGRTVTFLTGLCVLDAANGHEQTAVVPTTVRFRQLTAGEIDTYVAREQPYDCAGAFKSEALGIALVEAMTSDDPTALVGLPLIALCTMLRNAGMPALVEPSK